MSIPLCCHYFFICLKSMIDPKVRWTRRDYTLRQYTTKVYVGYQFLFDGVQCSVVSLSVCVPEERHIWSIIPKI